jgi:2-desacetyl-2-hydroxyethyl bacteriochlorophyllide A dehydrogenase
MLRAQIHAPGVVQLDDVEEPRPGPRDAVVEVARCGICGSDVGYVRLGGLAGPSPEPMPLGHELSGTVVEVGAEVDCVAPGARVALHPGAAGFAIGNGGPEGGFARRLLVREAAAGRSLFPIPDDMPFETAALAEPLGVGMNAVDRARVAPGDRPVVLGAGPIGLAAVATLVDRGFDDVVAVDPSETRRSVARALGAGHVIDPGTQDLWKELGRIHGTVPFYGVDYPDANVFIEASGASALLRQLVDRVRPEARISVVAIHRQEVPIPFLTVMMKQLTLQGAMEYPERYDDMLDLLARRDLTPMITHRFRLEDFLEALAVARDPARGAKVMIEVA